MYEQRVTDPKLKGKKGTFIFLAVIAAAFLGSAFFTKIEPYVGRAASMGFILYGCGVAWFVMSRVIACFDYVTDGNSLQVFRAYGKRRRVMTVVWLGNVQGFGTFEDMRKKFPGARLDKAVKPQNQLETFAIAYRDDNRQAILVIQPDEKMREILNKGLKKK